MLSVKISSVKPFSKCWFHGIKSGDELLSVDGKEVTDILDYDFYLSFPPVVLNFRTASGKLIDIPFKMEIERQPWNKEFPLIRDSSKCIKCMRCVQVCEKVQGLGVWDVEGTGSRTTINVAGHRTIEEADCALCGQCITHCPVGALRVRDDTEDIWDAIADPDKIVVAQVAPAVRTAWGEEFGLSDDEATVGKILDALKRMGVEYSF